MKKIIVSDLKKEYAFQASTLISALHDTLVQTRQDIFVQKEQDWEEYLISKLEDNDWIIKIALIDNKVVGVCTSQIKYCGDGEETKKRVLLFVDYIAVSKENRRNKIGSILLDEMKKSAVERGVTSLELNVWGFNAGAIQFYEKNNMKPKRIIYEYILDKE